MHYAGANRPLYFIRDNELTETKADKMSIGGHIELEEKRFTNHVIKTLPGDVIYLSSDGFADQFSPQDKKLMTKRFKEVILSIQSQSMKEQGEFLNEYLSNWKGAMEQTDDVLVIGVKI